VKRNNDKYLSAGLIMTRDSNIMCLRERVQRLDRMEAEACIREAVQFKSASGFLRELFDT
jgi:hypothetical protein